MKIFIGWSGMQGKAAASAYHRFLANFHEEFQPWTSGEDIAPGVEWGAQLRQGMQGSSFAIVCLTPDSAKSQWITFEVGFLMASLSPGYLFPCLVGVRIDDLEGPLRLVQVVESSRAGTLRMLEPMNDALGPHRLGPRPFQARLDSLWPDLETGLQGAAALGPTLGTRDLELMVSLISDLFSRVEELRTALTLRGFPARAVNWNMALIDVARAIVEQAHRDGRLSVLLDDLRAVRPNRVAAIEEVRARLSTTATNGHEVPRPARLERLLTSFRDRLTGRGRRSTPSD